MGIFWWLCIPTSWGEDCWVEGSGSFRTHIYYGPLPTEKSFYANGNFWANKTKCWWRLRETLSGSAKPVGHKTMKMTCNIHPSIFVYITSTALERSQFVYGRWYPTRDMAKLQNWLFGIKLGRIENIQRSWKLVFSSLSTHQNYKKYGFSVAKRRAVAKLEKIFANCCKHLCCDKLHG